MELWVAWTQFLEGALGFLSLNFGFSEAASIIILTLVARTLMMPLSLGAAYSAQINKEKMERVKPELEKIRAQYKDNPQELGARTMAIYRTYGIKFVEKKTFLNIVSQFMFGLGIFKVLKRTVFRSNFFWIADLGKPDFFLALLAGLFMAAGMALMPETSGQVPMWVMLAIPVLLSVIAVATFPSAIGIYWTTSNVVAIGQNLALRGLMARRQRLQFASRSKTTKMQD
jgi:YidC/Oxa1 family membrane protein insertase